MKLSIIIALYNTETFIEKCIRSIYVENELSADQYEVIVINDGSTDNSRIIIERLQNEFSNIKLINKENGGQSTARNIGFNLAKGDYIFCLDSDDFIDSNVLVKALNYCIKNDLDMLPIFYRTYSESYDELKEKKDNYPIVDIIMEGGDFMNKFVVSGSMWRYLYKTSLLKQYNLFLTEGIYHEDEEFIIKILSYTKRISYQRHMVYNHIVRFNSTVNKKTKEHRDKLLKDLLVVIKNLEQHRHIFNETSKEYIGISKKLEQLTVSIFLRMKADKLNFAETKYFINELKEFNLYPLKIRNLSFKFKLVAMLFNNSFLNKIYYNG